MTINDIFSRKQLQSIRVSVFERNKIKSPAAICTALPAQKPPSSPALAGFFVGISHFQNSVWEMKPQNQGINPHRIFKNSYVKSEWRWNKD